MKLLAVALLSLAVAVPAVAQTQKDTLKVTEKRGVVATTEMLKSGKNIEKITCKSFNALDESFKPQAVGYAVDYGKRARPKDFVMDVSGVEKITPVVIDTCKAHPERPLLDRVKAAFHHKK